MDSKIVCGVWRREIDCETKADMKCLSAKQLFGEALSRFASILNPDRVHYFCVAAVSCVESVV